MLADFIAAIGALAKEADRPKLLAHDRFPDVVFTRSEDGTAEALDVPPPRRLHKLLGLDDVIAAVKDAKVAPDPEVYHGPSGICVLLDRHCRRDTVSMPFDVSARYQVLRELQGGKAFAPKDAVKFLRYTLHGTGIEGVVQALRRIDFSRTSGGTSDVRHGKETLGRAVEAAVQQADSVPEEFVVSTPVYTNAGLREATVRVKVSIYLEVMSQAIELGTMPDELEASQVAVQRFIHDALVGALPGVPIFHGIP